MACPKFKIENPFFFAGLHPHAFTNSIRKGSPVLFHCPLPYGRPTPAAVGPGFQHVHQVHDTVPPAAATDVGGVGIWFKPFSNTPAGATQFRD